MLYFSELYGSKIYDQGKHAVGKLIDLLFIPADTPLITNFVIKTAKQGVMNVPVQSIRKNGIGFILQNNYEQKKSSNTDISLRYKLLNQQIVDIDGSKVIRVNDVIITNVPDYSILGIDIGVLGVFRWIGGSKLLSTLLHHFNIQHKSEYIPWSEVEPEQLAVGRIILKSERERLKRIHPEDLAEHLEHATIRNVLRALQVMDKGLSARVIADLNVDYQREIFKRFSAEHAGHILSLIDADEAVDVLLSLDTEKRDEIIQFIERGKKGAILYLLQHAKTPIGHIMTNEFVTVPSDFTVKKTIDKIKRNTEDFSELLYVYALNNDNQVVGVVNIHELTMQNPDVPLYRFMNQNLVLGRLTTPKEIVLRRMIKYHIYAVPIVNDERQLLGIVSLQDIAEDIIP